MTYPPTTPTPKALVRNIRQERAHILGTIQLKLTFVEITLSTLEGVFVHDKGMSAHLAKIRRWMEECWRSVGQGSGRKLSAEVLRRADREVPLVDEARRSVIGDCNTPAKWAAWLVAIDALVHDVVASMVQGRPRCWGYLGQTWDTLARHFLVRSGGPGAAEENGTAIYERVVEANQW